MILVTAIVSIQLATAGGAIGVAVPSQHGRLCVAMPAPALTPGTTITLIRPADRQSVLVANIVRSVPDCKELDGPMIPGPYYLAETPSPSGEDSAAMLIAFPGRLSTRQVGTGTIAVRLSAAYPDVQVRSCTSQEGVHLTAWSGTPLVTRRLWHQYYYLGYDVAASCDARDAAREGSNLKPSPYPR